MDRQQLADALAKAEEHIRTGKRIISRQREILAELKRDGHATAQAEQLLREFEHQQARFTEDCNRIRAELAGDRS